jgi:hypothetical protein
MRYAQTTQVSCDRSEGEIKATLLRYGADQYGSMWDGNRAGIQFRVKNKLVKFILPLPLLSEFKFVRKWKSDYENSPEQMQKQWEQACRQHWRALALAIKAKLEAIECGITTFEEEFLAHIVVPGLKGMTMGDVMLKRLEESYETNKAPALSWDGK